MSRTKPYIGISEAQANAEALMRRSSPYTAASDMSFRVQWDHHRREPSDLRDAVRQARRAYADEIPVRLHEGPDAIGEGGTPRMTAKAEGYIMGSASGSDAPKAKCICGYDQYPTRQAHLVDCTAHPTNQPLVSYYHSPFRAYLETLSKGDETERMMASVVQRVTVGSTGPIKAVIEEGVPRWSARWVAEGVLYAFLRGMTDLKLHLPRVDDDSEPVYAEHGTA